jgi:hypothetical protein
VHGCLSAVNVEASVTSRSAVQRNPTEWCVSECDREASIMGRPWHTGGSCATIYIYIYIYIYMYGLFVHPRVLIEIHNILAFRVESDVVSCNMLCGDFCL